MSYQTWIDERCKEALRHLNDPDAPVTLKRLSWNTLLHRKKGLAIWPRQAVMEMADMKDDGGPAFPHRREVYSHHDDAGKAVRIPVVHPGMSLRQWYAGLAMRGLLANGQQCLVEEDAIKRADALIAKLKKK